METEIVFEILAEGGSLYIKRQKGEFGENFQYSHNEFDPIVDCMNISINREYNCFEEPFQLINSKYPWYYLLLETVHADFRNYISEMLIDKLNSNLISSSDLRYNQDQLEHALAIILHCEMINEQPQWSYRTSKQ
jgi:hypothetical protein